MRGSASNGFASYSLVPFPLFSDVSFAELHLKKRIFSKHSFSKPLLLWLARPRVPSPHIFSCNVHISWRCWAVPFTTMCVIGFVKYNDTIICAVVRNRNNS